MQAVTTGAYRAVEYIKKNMDLNKKEADIEDSKTVVRICTEYAQSGMWNIFIALMTITLAFAFFDPNFFVAYLISIAVFGLFQAIYMANAGGAWDNAKKLVEVDLKEKGTAAARRDRHRRHRRRSVQGHDLRGPQPDHQVLHAVRPARGGNRRRHQTSSGPRHGERFHALRGRGDLFASLRLALFLFPNGSTPILTNPVCLTQPSIPSSSLFPPSPSLPPFSPLSSPSPPLSPSYPPPSLSPPPPPPLNPPP